MNKYFLFLALFFLTSCGTSPDKSLDTTKTDTPRTILALGDSLTAGYGLPEEESYPSQLEKKLTEAGYNYQLINAGIS